MQNYSSSYMNLSEEQKQVVNNVAMEMAKKYTEASVEEKDVLLKYCFDTLRPSMTAIMPQYDEICNGSYGKFMTLVALDAVACDGKATYLESKAIEKVVRIAGGQPDLQAIQRMAERNARENSLLAMGELVDISKRLTPSMRGIYLSFVLTVCSYDNEVSLFELSTIVNILAP
ncbi:MAG: hypothetical protein II163_08800 [Ruminococcus sp.]|nr:hypothetical protein [Ruminococcus sp.]MBQ1899250.1 hypothetical protein [Ruminococcus sp.]